MNANLESLEKIHGKEKAESVFREIADLGGFGSVGASEGSISASYAGGLDLAGVLADSNTALSGEAKDKIASLAGVTRAHATGIVDDKTAEQSSAEKMQPSAKENK